MASSLHNTNADPLKVPTLTGVLNYGVIAVKSDKDLEDLHDIDIEKSSREDNDLIYFDESSQSWKNSDFVSYFNSLELTLDGGIPPTNIKDK